MNNYRVKFMTSEHIDDNISKNVGHDFIMAGVDVGHVSDHINKGYQVVGEIAMIELGPIVPAPEQKSWVVELYTISPSKINPYPSLRIREGIQADEGYKAIEQAKAFYTSHGHTEIEVIGAYEGPYEQDKLPKPTRW